MILLYDIIGAVQRKDAERPRLAVRAPPLQVILREERAYAREEQQALHEEAVKARQDLGCGRMGSALSTNEVAANVMDFDRFGKQLCNMDRF